MELQELNQDIARIDDQQEFNLSRFDRLTGQIKNNLK